MTSTIDIPELVERAREGQPRAIARLISLVEDAGLRRGRPRGNEQLRAVAAALAPYSGNARVIGLTGPPGVGKSTFTSAMVSVWRERGKRVGVLAIDPSSPLSGGALLGDRIRMQSHATDSGVFIRSMASRGHLGGLAWATPQALRVLDAAGFDVVLIETVGVGQSEVEIVSLADTTLVLLAPGMGDGIQAAKAGILEIADVFVVNKADRDGADQTARELKHMISLGRREIRGAIWRQPIVPTVAVKSSGVDKVVEAIDAHTAWMAEHGELQRRRASRAATEVEAIAIESLRARFGDLRDGAAAILAEQVAAGQEDPYSAAERLIDGLRDELS